MKFKTIEDYTNSLGITYKKVEVKIANKKDVYCYSSEWGIWEPERGVFSDDVNEKIKIKLYQKNLSV